MGLGRNYCCCGPSDSLFNSLCGIKGRPLSCLSFALTAFCPQRCRIQPWHAVDSSKGMQGTPNQSAVASVALRAFMRRTAMRKHWLLLTCNCVATAMAPPRLARRRFIGAATAFVPGLAVGANLPSDNGAKGDQRGTVAALVPIVRIASGIAQASRAVQAGKLQDAQKALDAIPATEKPFKRLFDEYSEPISYKQKYKDSNAFVVYYTQGFDQCGNQPVRRAGLEVLFTILAASTQRESAWRLRTRRLRLTRPNV